MTDKQALARVTQLFNEMSNQLTPREARRKWQSSTVPNPVAVCKAIFKKHSKKTNKELVALCVAAGVAKNTADVTISRLKSKSK